jgi:putative membrane protein
VTKVDPKDAAELERLRQAAETNLLVWIRTCLAMMGFGFVLARFGLFLRTLAEAERIRPRRPPGFSLLAGTSLIVLGVLFLTAAVVLHVRLVGRLMRGRKPEVTTRWSLAVVAAVALTALGIVLASYMAFIE